MRSFWRSSFIDAIPRSTIQALGLNLDQKWLYNALHIVVFPKPPMPYNPRYCTPLLCTSLSWSISDNTCIRLSIHIRYICLGDDKSGPWQFRCLHGHKPSTVSPGIVLMLPNNPSLRTGQYSKITLLWKQLNDQRYVSKHWITKQICTYFTEAVGALNALDIDVWGRCQEFEGVFYDGLSQLHLWPWKAFRTQP